MEALLRANISLNKELETGQRTLQSPTLNNLSYYHTGIE